MRGPILPSSTFLLATIILVACQPEPRPTPFPSGTYLMQDWVFTFRDDGSFTANDLITTEEGTYSVNGDRLNIAGDYCLGQGEYEWHFDGTQLTFAAITDDCEGRRITMEEGPWILQP